MSSTTPMSPVLFFRATCKSWHWKSFGQSLSQIRNDCSVGHSASDDSPVILQWVRFILRTSLNSQIPVLPSYDFPEMKLCKSELTWFLTLLGGFPPFPHPINNTCDSPSTNEFSKGFRSSFPSFHRMKVWVSDKISPNLHPSAIWRKLGTHSQMSRYKWYIVLAKYIKVKVWTIKCQGEITRRK